MKSSLGIGAGGSGLVCWVSGEVSITDGIRRRKIYESTIEVLTVKILMTRMEKRSN